MFRTTLTKLGLSLTAALWLALLCVTGQSQTNFNYPDFSNTSGITFNGSAAQVGNLIRLTTATTGQDGSANFSPSVATTCSFQSHFQFNLHDGTRADGITFMIQNSGAGVNALGGAGGGMGYFGITPSVAVEFNIFQNGPPPDNDNNHVAILTNGQLNDMAQTNPGFQLWNAGAGVITDAWIDYDATAHILNIFVAQSTTKPATPLISFPIDIAATMGSSSGFVGFTGATGAATAVQDILNFRFAQACEDTFLVNYFAGARGSRPDQTVRITNPGTRVEGAGDTADLCANIYVFSPDQQLAECCSCFVSPNGLRTLSVDFDLANNPLTPTVLGEGVIKIVASEEFESTDNPGTVVTSKGACLQANGPGAGRSTAASAYTPVPALRAWGVHNQDVSSPGSLSGAGVINQVTETHFLGATLSQAERTSLQANCDFIQRQGSGAGKCTCGRGD